MDPAMEILTYWSIAVGISLLFSFFPRSSNPMRPGVYESKGRFLITPWYFRFGQLFCIFVFVWFAKAWDEVDPMSGLYLFLAVVFLLLGIVLFFMGYGRSLQRKT